MDKNVKTGLIIGGIIVAVLIVVSLVFGRTSGWQDSGWGMMDGFGWGWFMPIFMILFWGLVIWGIVALVRGTSGPRSPDSTAPTADSAIEVLKKRYARGEIGKEEYEEKKKDLI